MTKAKMPVEIRPLQAADQAAWRGLWAEYLEFYGTTVPDDVYATTFTRLLGDDNRDFNALVAVQNGTPVGLTHYLFHRHCWRLENVCYLQDLYASPSVRGTGVGRKLIEGVYAEADAASISSVYWLTQDDNHTGRQLYDRVGTVTNFIKYQRPSA